MKSEGIIVHEAASGIAPMRPHSNVSCISNSSHSQLLQFLNTVCSISLAVQHHMAIRTNWHKISHWINHIFLTDFADRLDVMHFDLSSKFFTKGNTEVESAHLTGCTMHGNTASTSLRITLILISRANRSPSEIAEYFKLFNKRTRSFHDNGDICHENSLFDFITRHPAF